jgi:hypothetical protein
VPSPRRNDDLDAASAMDLQPGTRGDACSALHLLCGQRLLNANTDTLAAAARCVRLRSQKSVTVHMRLVGDSYVI